MARHDIEWEQKGTHEEHLSVLDYKKQERSKEVAALENQIDTLQEQTAVAATALSEKQEQLDDIAPILKNTEKFAKVQKLEKENSAFKSANWNHTDEIVKLKMENQELHKAKDKLDALVGRIGNEVLQKLLRKTPKEQPKHKEESL